MSGWHRTSGSGTGHGSGLWPVLLALLVVLVPTACVLWFLNEAVQNQRLAMRQKLTDAYRGQLSQVRDRLEAYWQETAKKLDAEAASYPARKTLVTRFECALDVDSLVCYGPSGDLLYPAPANVPAERAGEDRVFAEAALLEYVRHDPVAAAAAYGKIASGIRDDQLAARALQAQARCLARAGRVKEAIRVLAHTLGQAKYAHALDPQGRLIAADAQLRVLELIDDHSRPDFIRTADRLADDLVGYKTPLPATQRLFLMKEVTRLTDGEQTFFALPAEELAEAYLESHSVRPDHALRPSGLPDVWHFATPSGRVVGLLRGARLRRMVDHVPADETLPSDVQVALLPPGTEAAEGVEHILSAGPMMPGWRFTLSLLEGEGSDATIRRRIAVNTWIAALVIGAMAIVALLVAAVFRRQMRLTRLRNDLLATVSHELKTPLASIRLLVDTLLDAEPWDVGKARDYLRLVAKENARLSHLIDNFLSFSRMERGKQAFEFAEVSPAEIVQRAAEVVAERFQLPGCCLDVEAATDTPALWADSDALVTAVLNLLDNAYKYTGDCKHVLLRAYAENGNVCFAVSDNGIGLSPWAVKKVFRPFYQVDRRLSRSAGGCGLGLSIVQFIVAAHGGAVRVQSQPGAGSTFTLSIPQVRP